MKKIVQMIVIIGIMMLSNLKSNAQASSTIHTYIGGDWIGWTSATQALDFKYGPGVPTTIMQLIPATGDLNLVNGTSGSHQNAFQIGGNSVLWHNGNLQDIFSAIVRVPTNDKILFCK